MYRGNCTSPSHLHRLALFVWTVLLHSKKIFLNLHISASFNFFQKDIFRCLVWMLKKIFLGLFIFDLFWVGWGSNFFKLYSCILHVYFFMYPFVLTFNFGAFLCFLLYFWCWSGIFEVYSFSSFYFLSFEMGVTLFETSYN